MFCNLKYISLFALMGLFTLGNLTPVHADTTSSVESHTPSTEDMEILKNAVKSALKDPNSAEFRDVIMMQGNGGIGACLEVNAKNSFGGFTGFQTALLFKLEGTWLPVDIDDHSMEICQYILEKAVESEQWKQ